MVIPRRLRGIPDSEFEPAVVKTLKLGVRAASIAAIVEVLPAEPVTPIILSLGLRSLSLKIWALAKKRR